MRIFRVLSMVVLVVFLLSACSPIQKEGLENFHPAHCSYGLCQQLFPTDSFLSDYKYIDGDFYFIDTQDFGWGYAKAFAYLTFDPEIYIIAKQYCLDSFLLSDENCYQWDNYHFSEHICYKGKDADGEWILKSDFPRHFNMFGYHDESCTLFFLGYYNGDPQSKERELAVDDFYAFLKEVFGDYYTFP